MGCFGHVKFFARSEVGLKRQNNEDSHGEFPAHGVWCVADGMGGGDDGEVASAAVIQAIDTFCKSHPMPEPNAYSGKDIAQAVVRAVNTASQWIFRRAVEKSLKGCGSTFVGVVLDAAHPENAIVLHAGDSRLYRIRGREIKQITKDHSAAEMIGAKSEADINPMFRGMILRAVGVRPSVDVESTPMPVRKGDVVLICSDGLSKMVSDKAIAAAVREHAGDVKGAADALIGAAYAAGATDNVTLELLEIGDLPSARPTVQLSVDETSTTGTAGKEASTRDTSTGVTGALDPDVTLGTIGAVTSATGAAEIFAEAELVAAEQTDGSSARWIPMAIGALIALAAVGIAAAVAWWCFLRTPGRPPTEPVREAPPPAEAVRAQPPEEKKPVQSVKPAEAGPDVPTQEAHVPKDPAVKAVPEDSAVKAVPASKVSAEDQERAKLLKELQSRRNQVRKAEADAAAVGQAQSEAVKGLIEVCKSPSFAEFTRQLGERGQKEAGDRLWMLGKGLAGMKADDDRVVTAAGDLVVELQKIVRQSAKSEGRTSRGGAVKKLAAMDPVSVSALELTAKILGGLQWKRTED